MIELRPLTPSIGAEVVGIDLAEPLDDGRFAEVDKAFMDHKVLFFRDQHITTEQHIAFCRHFGDLEVHPFVPPKPGYPEVMVLVHDESFKGAENNWHSDVTWRLEPSLGSMLRAIEVPDVGGDTLFADMEAAYDGLGPEMQRMLDGLVAVHDFARVFARGQSAEQIAKIHEKYPPAEHPVIRTHPVTGRKSIYVNVAFTSHIKGLKMDESLQLLTYLYRQASRPEYQCRFKWAPDSFALWDNRSVQHYAVSDYWPHRRVMERVTIVGDKPPLTDMHAERLERVRGAMAARDIEVLLLSVGPDLPWLIGYEAMPLERLTMLVVPVDGDATLVVPRLEAPRVVERPGVFAIRPWEEREDPLDLVAGLARGASSAAIGDRTWSQFLLGLQSRLGTTTFRRASEVTGPLRAVKDAHEIDALAKAGAAVDRVAAALHAGEIPLVGRTEADVSAELGRRMLAEGHHRVNFAIVGAGENAASPHHDASDRVIAAGEVVLCDFGASMLAEGGAGYCSDITRCVYTGEPPAEFAELYDVLHEAQAAAVAAATVGRPAQEVDAAARSVIEAAGYGEQFIHRTGHGIGVEEHEDPYIVDGNDRPLVAGNAFSVEPGIYVPGRWGARLEDIVVATDAGPRPVNAADHALVVVDG